jgi:GTP pyrophosphokinase
MVRTVSRLTPDSAATSRSAGPGATRRNSATRLGVSLQGQGCTSVSRQDWPSGQRFDAAEYTSEVKAMQPPLKPEPILSPRFSDALFFTCQLHRDQARKGTTIPYVSHLLAVTAIVLEHGGSEDEAIAALLHDAVEDQGGATTREAIRVRFGESVAAIVDGCTDADTIPKPPWKERKEKYVAHIPHASHSVRLVSAADKLHNARAILADYHQLGEELWRRFNGRREGTLWYYRALADAFHEAEPSALTKELNRTVAELERVTAA